MRKFKETKKQFDKVREDMEIAQVKNAQAPRNKPHEVEEASSALVVTRKCFRHLALDYVLQVTGRSHGPSGTLVIVWLKVNCMRHTLGFTSSRAKLKSSSVFLPLFTA